MRWKNVPGNRYNLNVYLILILFDHIIFQVFLRPQFLRSSINLDEFERHEMKFIVHDFFSRNEPPTIRKVHNALLQNEVIPKMSMSSTRAQLKKLNFRWVLNFSIENILQARYILFQSRVSICCIEFVQIALNRLNTKIETKTYVADLKMFFRYVKRGRKSMLIEREEIISWRREYLWQIRKYREENRPIFYLDETHF